MVSTTTSSAATTVVANPSTLDIIHVVIIWKTEGRICILGPSSKQSPHLVLLEQKCLEVLEDSPQAQEAFRKHLNVHHTIHNFTARGDAGAPHVTFKLEVERNKAVAEALKVGLLGSNGGGNELREVWAVRVWEARQTLEFDAYPVTKEYVKEQFRLFKGMVTVKGIPARELVGVQTFLTREKAREGAQGYLNRETSAYPGPWGQLVEVDGMAFGGVVGADRKVREMVTVTRVDLGRLCDA